jgi:lipopolysaccharide/colanic/teichoic acid biosynthesis glycosyltransferase
MKKIIDFTFSIIGLLLFCPVLFYFLFAVWIKDFHSPLYISKRIGRNGKEFNFIKIRSMVVNADKSGVDSTSENDDRITPAGKLIRKYKIDEIPQLIHVFLGQMSFVGPRPNVKSDVSIYTSEEMKLLETKPGITDFSSIVFSDEGEILSGSQDPDLKYNQLIRPWKSRLGLFYVEHKSLYIDLTLIALTIISILNRDLALKKVSSLLKSLGADEELIKISKRESELFPYPPPGSQEIVQSR